MKIGSTPNPLHYLHVIAFLVLCVDLCTTPTECEHSLPDPVSNRTIAKGGGGGGAEEGREREKDVTYDIPDET